MAARLRALSGATLSLTLCGIVLCGLVAALLLDRAPRVAGANDSAPFSFVSATGPGEDRLCQTGETFYKDSQRLRVTIGTYGRPGPAVGVEIREHDGGGRILARGGLEAGWKEGPVEIPIAPVPAVSRRSTQVCFDIRDAGKLAFAGETTDRMIAARLDGAVQPGRVAILALLPGEPTLLASLGRVRERYAAGGASWMGGWVIWLITAVVVVAVVLAGRALHRARDGAEGRGRVPRACRRVVLVGFLTTAAWSLLIPPFMVPDEISHVGYVQTVAETGRLPIMQAGVVEYSEEQRELLKAIDFYETVGRRDSRPPWIDAEERAIRAVEERHLPRETTNAATASANPPLYYLAELPAYYVAAGGSLLDQLTFLRLLSALMGALTVGAIFLFLRELLPGSPWTWTAGALVAAFQPMFGFVSSGVNADSLLFLFGALTLYAMARVLRRGIGHRRSVVMLGVVVAGGALTKPLSLALVPPVLLALAVAGLRARRELGLRQVLARVALAGTIAFTPILAYHVAGTLAFDHGYFQKGSSVATVSGGAGQVPASRTTPLNYVWQLFLPRIPGTDDKFTDDFPLREIWFNGMVGRFGWLDYDFKRWVTDVALVVAWLVLAAALAALVRFRDRLRGRWLELACYASALVCVAGVVGALQYGATLTPEAPQFIQSRYLLPLLALYAAVAAVAVRLPGRRVGPLAAVPLVALAALHTIAAMLLTVTRYYL